MVAERTIPTDHSGSPIPEPHKTFHFRFDGAPKRQPEAAAICATARVSPRSGRSLIISRSFLMQLSDRASKQGADERTPVNSQGYLQAFLHRQSLSRGTTSATGQAAAP